jgi:hypothetical protein
MNESICFYVIDTDSQRASQLRQELAALSNVRVVQSYADAVSESGGLDVLLVPLMSAIESGAISPPAPLYQTQVIKVPSFEIARGRPDYAIPGVAIKPNEELAPQDSTRLVLRETLRALKAFNRGNKHRLTKVGAPSLSLGFDKLARGEARSLLSEAYAETSF